MYNVVEIVDVVTVCNELRRSCVYNVSASSTNTNDINKSVSSTESRGSPWADELSSTDPLVNEKMLLAASG